MQFDFKKSIKIFLVISLTAMVIGYGWFRTKDFLAGPVIEITSPQNGATLTEPLVEVKGVAKNISDISLNGRKIFTDKEGAWSEKVLLHPGYNIITLSASDRFDRKVEKKLEVVLKENEI